MREPIGRGTIHGASSQYWIEEVLVFQHGIVWVMIDTTFRTLTWTSLPAATVDEIAIALEQARMLLVRPERWPTRPLPIVR